MDLLKSLGAILWGFFQPQITYQSKPHREGGVKFVVHPDEGSRPAVVGGVVTASLLRHDACRVIHIAHGIIDILTAIWTPETIKYLGVSHQQFYLVTPTKFFLHSVEHRCFEILH